MSIKVSEKIWAIKKTQVIESKSNSKADKNLIKDNFNSSKSKDLLLSLAELSGDDSGMVNIAEDDSSIKNWWSRELLESLPTLEALPQERDEELLLHLKQVSKSKDFLKEDLYQDIL